MAKQDSDNTTHFGYQDVSADDKANLVRGVFDSVASRYDIMNDLMSAGLHRLWKRHTIAQAAARPGDVVLDLAGGTGDLAREFSKKVGPTGHVVLADINAAMLKQGRSRLVDAGVSGNLSIAQVDAQDLPFEDGTFDCITIAFGLRNVTDKEAALRSMFRVLKTGGKAMILEFSEPSKVIKPAYDLYSFKVLPAIGKLVTGDPDSYQYLAESIRMHPDQETLKAMMEEAGFERCRYNNLAAGIVALHIGYRI
ncbi:MAG: bifunctional demethylmenaquinone methyltransferase/2-methoxy-6-polyprenyl-1,4-benzoquinol methylase UbiE [Gammaproteobacteria bacterium]|jgi:demethylmenaquinone methyltransferase/2-methoxy-6-polyprenyl-1,4-benzoquinol methylase|nr:bifunctional demethylmenaquinone methyltransferase/2-methoxy-6-polyprenyl-1,4-benzoquinol methylase UbiE [Gammaproteobacteria bacterium]MDH3778308.1 bifunctional demethylmenaquinone methyltransferase/2-methoxy-6-polyprenyl-1,4-benzoquinol methylase UbiE [Gammaproteobacteria bacterium]MDH3810094.1 bifunctional demethylmenaquinone methyltransferase/2-methoxy-6-polyprenyl-1,4-benzoquinol methylase UbiE [Gammaproteobacteria bacterium]